MNHPDREKLISYLYEESFRPESQEIKDHLATCCDCRAEIESWQNVQTQMNEWRFPIRSRHRAVSPFWKWGIAAMLMISLGFAVARVTAPKFDSAKLEKELRAEFNQQLATARARDHTQLAALLDKMEQNRAVDYAELRSDLETVALTAEATLRRTQRQIGELSLIAQNGSDSTQLNKN